jgi:hypothetical protein
MIHLIDTNNLARDEKHLNDNHHVIDYYVNASDQIVDFLGEQIIIVGINILNET